MDEFIQAAIAAKLHSHDNQESEEAKLSRTTSTFKAKSAFSNYDLSPPSSERRRPITYMVYAGQNERRLINTLRRHRATDETINKAIRDLRVANGEDTLGLKPETKPVDPVENNGGRKGERKGSRKVEKRDRKVVKKVIGKGEIKVEKDSKRSEEINIVGKRGKTLRQRKRDIQNVQEKLESMRGKLIEVRKDDSVREKRTEELKRSNEVTTEQRVELQQQTERTVKDVRKKSRGEKNEGKGESSKEEYEYENKKEVKVPKKMGGKREGCGEIQEAGLKDVKDAKQDGEGVGGKEAISGIDEEIGDKEVAERDRRPRRKSSVRRLIDRVGDMFKPRQQRYDSLSPDRTKG